ncbi:protein kinase [Nocardia sp. NPDC052278]|uniref:protein kinase domain-containing protein n=1 Tax=unclassified Nocardia TaxID=2637762 RepID=UPI0036951B54
MPDFDGDRTQRDLDSGITAELASAGFVDAEEIGRGGFGVVYRCREESLDRTVAVKVLTSEIDGSERKRFLREQHALGRLSGHPNIVVVHHADITDTGHPFLVMPFYARGSLDARLHTAGPVPWPELLSIGVKLAGALATAHAGGILHRDVKPANILVTDYSEPQLADFGIAHIGDGFETSARRISGTPAYLAPEVLHGEPPTAASDIYGLGATLFCMLTGHAAFERRSGEGLMAHFLRVTSTPVPDLRELGVPTELNAVIETAMAVDATQRPGSAVEFGNRVRDIQRRMGLAVDIMAVPSDVVSRVPGASPYSAGPTPNRGGSGMPPVISTKFRPPTATGALVERPRLLQMLRDGGGRRLTVIRAPAGFGKSTLARQWREALEADGVPVAWLTVDPDDDNVVWFLVHLVEAIRRVRPDLAEELGALLEEYSGDVVRYVLATLVDEIHTRGEQLALVLEDWHQVTGPATISALGFLLDNGCHHLRVIVTSRTAAGLPLSCMRVRDELIEIGSAELRFDDTEARSFVADAKGLTLDETDSARLCASTEGWAAALQLASLSLRGREDPSEFIDQLSGRHEGIGDYLVENVVDTLEPGLLHFLLSTAITERTCADLAETLSGVGSGRRMLGEVENRELFLSSIDDCGEWFRYHRLFVEFLRRRLMEQDPNRVVWLHRAASAWFADHGLLHEAVDHALLAGEPDAAVRLIEARATELIEASRTATLLGLVAKLPAALAASNPRLQLFVAWSNLSLQRTLAAQIALDRVDAALQADAAQDDSGDLRVGAALARAAGSIVSDKFCELPEIAERRVQSGDINPFLATVAAAVAAFAALYRFDFDEVARWQRWVAPYEVRSTGPSGVMYAHCLAGVAALEQLDVAAAEVQLRTAYTLAVATGRHTLVTRLAGALLGELKYEQGELDDAQVLLDESAEIGSAGGGVEFMLATYGTGARLTAARGDLNGAETRLAKGAKMARDLGLPRLMARIVNERIRLGQPLGDDERADLERLEPYGGTNGIEVLTTELRYDSAVRLLLREGSADATMRARAYATSLVRAIETQVRPRALVQAHLLSALCSAGACELKEAVAELDPALARCAETGLVRLAVDMGPGLAPAIQALCGIGPDERRTPTAFLLHVLAEMRSVGVGSLR